MNFQRISAIVNKNLKIIPREPAMLFFTVLFPLLLTLVYGVAFGAVGGGQQTSYQIGVFNADSSGIYSQWSQRFIGNLTTSPILTIQQYSDNETMQSDLAQGKIQAAILIPVAFGQSCNSFWQSPNNPSLWVNTTIQLFSDSGSLFATQAIPPIVQQILAQAIYNVQPKTVFGPIQIGIPSLITASKLTMFDYMAPGMFAFFAVFLIMTVAQSFTVEREKGLLRRINTTPTSATELMMGEVISKMVTAIIQVVIVFLSAYLVGFRPAVSPISYVLAFLTLCIFSLCCVGFGLVSATLVKSSSAATGAAFIFIIPQMLLGTYISFSTSSIMQTAGKLMPSYYVTDALTSLFLRGASPLSPTILLDVFSVSIVSFFILILGIFLFGKFGKT
jgi:ABC-2 type transport system permease protein